MTAGSWSCTFPLSLSLCHFHLSPWPLLSTGLANKQTKWERKQVMTWIVKVNEKVITKKRYVIVLLRLCWPLIKADVACKATAPLFPHRTYCQLCVSFFKLTTTGDLTWSAKNGAHCFGVICLHIRQKTVVRVQVKKPFWPLSIHSLLISLFLRPPRCQRPLKKGPFGLEMAWGHGSWKQTFALFSLSFTFWARMWGHVLSLSKSIRRYRSRKIYS